MLGHLDELRETLFQEIRSRVVETDVSVPVVDGPWAYYHRTVQGQDYAIHCRRPADRAGAPLDATTPPDDEQVVLDENALAEGHDYLAVGGIAVAPEHDRIAYLVDTDGDEEYALRVRDLATGRGPGGGHRPGGLRARVDPRRLPPAVHHPGRGVAAPPGLAPPAG